jgi:hypothetical protein
MGVRSPIAPGFRFGGDELSDYRRKESLERTILRVAKKNAGIATPSEVALEADAPIAEAKLALEKLASKGFAEMKIRKSGAIVFVFSEFVPDNSDFEDI